jgi:hypothetical protein
MKTKSILTISLALMLLLVFGSISTVAAIAAEKATGSFWAQSNYPNSDALVYLDFNAHEDTGTRAAKGQIYWYRDHPDYGDRDLWCDVRYVSVDAGKAFVAAYCWLDTAGKQTGKWLYMIVEDGGTPGSEGDLMWARWYNTELEASAAVAGMVNSYWVVYALVDGNLVVHE